MNKSKSFRKSSFWKPVIAILTFGLLMSGSGAAFGVDESPVQMAKRQYSSVSNLLPTSDMFSVKQYIGFQSLGGVSTNRTAASVMDMQQGKMCDGLDVSCLSTLKNVNLNGYFPLCQSETDSMCIVKLEIKIGDKPFEEAKVERVVDYEATPEQIANRKRDIAQGDPFGGTVFDMGIGTSWNARPDLGYPGSAPGPIVFSVRDPSNAAGTNLFTLQAQYIMNAQIGKGGVAVHPSMQNVSVGLVPTFEKSDVHGLTPITATRIDKWGAIGPISCCGGDPMAWETNAGAGYPVAFSPNTRVRLEMRLSSLVGGWFHGRLESPDLAVTPINAKTNRVVLEASDSRVPITGGWVLKYAKEGEPYLADLHLSEGIQTQDKAREAQGQGGMSMMVWDPRQGVALFHKWEPVLGDTAKGQADLWYFSMMPEALASGNKCLQRTDSLQGLITTNAMTYQAGLPAFEGGELAYQVAGLHNDFTGTPFEGSYNLIMRSEAARCLYGFTNAPISAKVSVTSATGEAKVATTTVGEKNGFLHLAATGFTFSDPTIHARLTQAASAKARPTKLTCIKGKLTKTVTGTAPKCPSGFTKK